MRQWERDRSCFDHLSSCLSQFYCWLPSPIRQQRRGYASGGIFTTAEADFTTTESTRKQVPCGPGERSRQSHVGQGLPLTCIRPAIRFIANTPLATWAGVVSSVVVRAISSKTHDERDRTRQIGLGGGPHGSRAAELYRIRPALLRLLTAASGSSRTSGDVRLESAYWAK